jgi:hypothetical protein
MATVPPHRMMILNAVAMIAILVGSRMDDSVLGSALEYGGAGLATINIVRIARAGYLLRRPYWTVDSWRRYLTAAAIPVGALILVLAIAAAVDMKLSIVGEGGSIHRFVVGVCALAFALFGLIGSVIVMGWMTDGEPSQQFTLPRWARFGL